MRPTLIALRKVVLPTPEIFGGAFFGEKLVSLEFLFDSSAALFVEFGRGDFVDDDPAGR